MKIKKIVLLPLLALVLAGCDFGALPSSSDNTSETTPIPGESSVDISDETSVTSDVVISDSSEDITSEPSVDPDVLVLTSFLQLAQTDLSLLTSLDFGLDIEFDLDLRSFAYDESEILTQELALIGGGVLNSSIKAAQLDTATPKATATQRINIALDDADDEEMLYINGDLALYYKEEWLYAYSNLAYSGFLADFVFGEEITIPEGEQKVKTEVGPFSLSDMIDEDDILDLGDFDMDEILEIWRLVVGTGNATKQGANTLVTYELDMDTLMVIALLALAESGEEIDEEDLDDVLAMMEDFLSKLITIDHAFISFLINADGDFVGLNIDVDFALTIPNSDLEFGDDIDLATLERTELDLKLEADLHLGINTPTVLIFPGDLETYVEDSSFLD